MPSQSPFPILFLALGALLGCDLIPSGRVSERETSAAFQTSELHYAFEVVPLGIEATIPYHFVNPGPDTVSIRVCPGQLGFVVQQRSDSEWRTVYPAPTSLRERSEGPCLAAPSTIVPGGEVRDSVRIFAGRTGDEVYPKFEADGFDGVYRIAWSNVVSGGQPSPLPERMTTSNSFSLSGPPGYP